MKDMEVFYAGNNGYMLRTNGVPSGFNGSLSAADRPGLILFVSFRQARVNQLGPVSA